MFLDNEKLINFMLSFDMPDFEASPKKTVVFLLLLIQDQVKRKELEELKLL